MRTFPTLKITRALFLLSLLVPGCTMDRPTTDKDDLILEMRNVLDEEFAFWYPLSIDTAYGGFYSDINARGELEGKQHKMIVTQARRIWSTANAAMFYQKDNSLRKISAHGVRFLAEKMWDEEFGGFYNLVDRDGTPVGEEGEILKHAYGNAFAIYGLTAYFVASGDTAALEMAQKTFQWLEEHSFDPMHGGYFEFLSREGVPFTDGYGGTPPKDQNSTIHLLEALAELYRVWPDELLRERLSSLLEIVRERITTEKGYMVLFFTRDWTPISYRDSSDEVRQKHYERDHVSFGHDVETAYLMLEASEALGMEADSATLRVAKKMVDHALRNGWDNERGGIYDRGYYFPGEERPRIIRRSKQWWAEAEAFHSFLLMSELFPDDELTYYEKFCRQWDYCKKYVIDTVQGGWYWGGTDVEPENRTDHRGTTWKADYHTSRALINSIRRLKRATLTYGEERFDPVNREATPEARKLLAELYSLKGKRIMAGHHHYVGAPDLYIDRVRELTGTSPAVWGNDFFHYYEEGNPERLVQEAYAKYKEGYIVTLMWHVGRPQDDPPFGWKESVQAEMTDAEWGELLTPGTGLHTRWLRQADSVARYLAELRDLGVPVLWRPYHELNGVWFWWGERRGQKGSAGLYRMMYERFVKDHKLNNLIWVWNANAPRQLIDDEAYVYEDYFPGLEYVDVLATDVYHNDYRQSHHDELVELGGGKLIALGEVGEVPGPEILKRQPMWSWFMVWGNFVNTHNTPEQMRALYSYPRVLTYEELTGRR